MGFLKSKSLGDIGEDYVSNILTKIGVEVEKSGKNPDYDLACKLKRTKFKIEVKYDWMAQKTGNLAIEYYNTKKCAPSGIDATKADIWCVCLEDGNNVTAWFVPTKLIRQYMKDNPPHREVSGGDKNSAMKLYRESDILPIFTRIDDKSTEEETLKVLRQVLKGIK